jgi:cytochrome o ubiquinol oxidase subunit II
VIKKSSRLICFLAVILCVISLAGCKFSHLSGGVLHPKGIIAYKELHLMIDSVLFMLIVVVPVIILSFAFAWKYRASNKKATYAPNWSHNSVLEYIWWGVPCVIILILSIMAWNTSHKLDPYRPIDGTKGKPITIQVVSLQWKWLFIYPEQDIATVNYIEIPKDRQIKFLITSDAPMNAFFIPQLASQIYSMAGMQTKLHLVANYNGVYKGFSANYSGDGFSDMKFNVKVTSDKDFNNWVKSVKKVKHKLYIPEYQQLVKPSEANPVAYYSDVRPKLFKRIMMQYMMPNMELHK